MSIPSKDGTGASFTLGAIDVGGALYVLGFFGGETEAMPAEITGGGWPSFDRPRKKKREDWRKALDELMSQPAPAVVVQALDEATPQEVIKAPQLTAAQKAYMDGVFAAIVRAKNEQDRARKLALIATAEREAMQAQMLLAQAIEAERVAKQQMIDFDLAFVAAVLIES